MSQCLVKPEQKKISLSDLFKKLDNVMKFTSLTTKMEVQQIEENKKLTKAQKKLRKIASYLRQAEADGVEQIKGRFDNGKGGMCALGAILFYAGKPTMVHGLDDYSTAYDLLEGTGVTPSMIYCRNDGLIKESFSEIAGWLESL